MADKGSPTRMRIFYAIGPAYTTLFATWKDAYPEKTGKLSYRSETNGILPVARELARELNLAADNVSPKTVFRMAIASAALGVDAAHAAVMRLNDKDAARRGPHPFDPTREALVFLPEVLGRGDGSVSEGAPPVDPGSVASEPLQQPLQQQQQPLPQQPADAEPPSVKFDHQKYDEGAFRVELARNVQETWDRLWNDEDPNRTIVAQILHDVFFRWAFKGFKSRPMGILLYGPPGNGKTFLFDKYLTKLGLTLTNTNYAASRFQKGKVGEGEAAMVAEASKCKEDRTRLYLMFIDEIDSIGADRNKKGGESYKIDYCNTLLAIVGQPEYSNLIVVGATNYKENLDEALIRDGRLQNHYFLPSLDKDRRLALLCDKLGDTLVDLFQIKSVMSPLQMSRIVKKKILEDVEVLNYFQRNTINFTFAQFDRLRSEVDGVWRLFDQHNPDDVNFARMFRELHKSSVTKEQILKNMSEDLIVNAISVYISHNLRVCLRDAVEKVLGSNQPNLRFNRMVLSRDNTTPAIDAFNREIKQFFEFHELYRSAVVSPTGRMILNVRDSSLNVELSNNTVITTVSNPDHRTFRFPNTFFRANTLSRMLEPVIAARNYGYVQIIDRETIDLDDEDRIFKLLKAKYEEAMALAKTDTASLLVINLSDIVGMITKIQQSVRVSTRTEKREETSNVGETSDSKIQSRAVENVKNNSKEQVILNAFESSYRQSLLDSEETLSSYENQLEFSNDLVKNSMEKESSSEKKQEQQEFTSKTTRNRSTKVSENESFLSRLMKKARKENVEQVSTTHVESTNVETVIGRETDKTFRTEITDTESQKITAETSTTNTKSRGTDLKHDNVQSLTQTDTQFTANTSHQKTLTSTNESLTDRDTFREEHLVEKSHIEEKRHEQIKSVEHDVSEGSRFSIVHEEKDEKVTALNRSKITSDTESFKVDDRTFTSQSHSKTISDSERTDTTRTDTTVDEESKNIDDQKQDTTRKTGTTGKEVADILEKTTNDSLSIKGSEGKSHTTDQSTDQGTTTQRKDLKDGSAYSTTTATAQGGWKNNSLFVDMTASEEIGVKANFTHSNDRTSTTASNLNINDNTTKSSSIDTDKSKATNTAKAESEIKKSDDTTGKSKSDIETGTKRGTTTGSDQITKSKTTSTTIEDKTEEGRSHDETTSRVHEETQRTEEVENTSQSVSDSTRRETYRDTRNTTTDTVRDTNSITDAQTTKDSTSQSKEQIKEITESRYEESQTLEEQGTRSETRRETSDTITKSEYESTMREEKTMQSQSASVEHSNTRTAAESERDFQSHTTTHGTRNEKETRKQEIMGQESAQEQERQKRREVETVENAVKEKEEVLRQLISKDTERLRETSMSEEYRKRLNDVITSRKQLQNQLTKEKEESQKKSQQVTTRNTDGSSTTVGTTSQLNETNTNRDEQSTSFVSDTSNEVEISQQMLRLKIIDVIGRFAGLASEYLNNFDLKRGPDVVFAVDNPLLATVVEKTISWGQLETPCPEDSLSIPQILFSDKYKAAFWLEVIELGLLEHLRIILTPVERGTQIELDCPQFVREKNNKDNESIADRLKSLELFGPLSQNNRPTLKFNDKMFGMIADQDKFCNLTTLTLTGLEVGLTPQRAYMKMTCRTLKSLNLSLCQIGIDGSNDEFASLSYILKLFSGNEYVLDAFPQLIEFALRSPISSLGSDGKPYKPITWVVTDNCIPVMEKLQLLDLTKNHIEAESVQRLFGFGVQNDDGERIGFGETLRTLVLDGCTLEGELDSKLGEDETPKGGSSLDAKEALKLNCYNVQPPWSARTAAFWANQAGKRTGRSVQIL